MEKIPTSNSTVVNFILPVSYWEQILLAVLIILIAIAGLIGNSMIIVAVAFSRKLHTSTNAFVTSLAISDLLASFFLIWFALSICGKDGWLIPQAYWICQLTAFMNIACSGISLYNLGFIAVNRLLLIIRPTLYKKIFTSWKLCICVAIPWIIPGVEIPSFLLTDTGAIGYDISWSSCSDIDTHEKAAIFNLGELLGLPIPLVAIVVSYLWIRIHVKKHFKKMRQNISVLATISGQDKSNGSRSNASSNELQTSQIEFVDTETSLGYIDQRRKQISQQEIEITKNLFCVVCAFFMCFLPFFITVVMPKTPGVIHFGFYAQLGPPVNSSINFLIYAYKHPDFKIVLGHMMRRSYAEIPLPSKLLRYLISKKSF